MLIEEQECQDLSFSDSHSVELAVAFEQFPAHP